MERFPAVWRKYHSQSPEDAAAKIVKDYMHLFEGRPARNPGSVYDFRYGIMCDFDENVMDAAETYKVHQFNPVATGNSYHNAINPHPFSRKPWKEEELSEEER